MQFGTRQTFVILEDGSRHETTETIRNGEKSSSYIMHTTRAKVKNQTEELAEYIKFRKDFGKQVVAFGIEYPQNYDGDFYYILKCYKETIK